MSRRRVAIELRGGWLSAVVLGVGKRPSAGPGLCERLPGEVDAADAQAVGRWAGEALKRAGVRGSAGVWVADRSDALLKRMTLPAPPDASQLPAMVRLQMSRAMPVHGSQVRVDYVETDREGGQVTLLAAAMPEQRLVWIRAMLSAARLPLAGVRVKAQHAAVLAGRSAEDGAGIVIVPGAASVEVVILEGGGVAMSRGVDAAWPAGEAEGFARRIAVEVKRTWMGYRSQHDSREVVGATVVGWDAVCRRIADEVGEAIEVPARTLEAASLPVAVPDDADPRWLGLCGASALDRQWAIDPANPRRVGPTRSKTRERALLGMMGVLAVAGGAGVLGYLALADIRDERSAVERRVGSLAGEYSGMLLERARLAHLESLLVSRPLWPEHLDRLRSLVASPDVRLGSVSGVSRGGVWFGDPDGSSRYSFLDAEYRPVVIGEFTLEGVAGDRVGALALRGRLVDDPSYTVQTSGPDAGPTFRFQVRTERRRPVSPEGAAAGSGDARSTGGGSDDGQQATDGGGSGP